MNRPSFKIACIIPTYNGKKDLARLLDSLQKQSAQFDLFIVDSSSKDGTTELAKSRCQNTLVIPSSEFNHGGTRQLMIDQNPKYDIYVFLTQDAYLEDPEAIFKITSMFSDSEVGAVCGRQLAHHDANLLAQHARSFKYPLKNQIKSLADAEKIGIKAAFMSNSFAAYRRTALESVSGFPRHVIFAEDMYAAAKMLLQGWKVGYSGDAACRHSHNYSITEEFRRYFDMGVFHARESWIRESFGSAGGEGLKYVISELKFLGLKKIYLWPLSFLRNAIKLFAYKLGQKESSLPISIKKRLGMYKGYWDSPYAQRSQ